MDPRTAAVWLISLLSIALVLLRPRGWPEAIWASAGACLLVLFRLMQPAAAGAAIAKGFDVYLFLIGMMVISELARLEGVFDWLARQAVRASKGSRARLFAIVYAVGIVVTVFLSNDATAVVLTPAVLAAVRAAGAEPLPYLFVCAFIANAASFVLPISNPANLVVYSGGMPPLGQWLRTFALPSVAAIVITFVLLRWLAAKSLSGPVNPEAHGRPLSVMGKLTLFGIAFLAIVLMAASAFHFDLGAPACAAGLLVAGILSLRAHDIPKRLVGGISWSVLPLVAGLFIIVEALNAAGALPVAVRALGALRNWVPVEAALSSGFSIGILSNLLNNLPSGLISAAAVKALHATGPLRDAVLVGVDLGPNLSITGSLATILWLIAIRRDGLHVSFWDFFRWGAVVMPPSLLLSILALFL